MILFQKAELEIINYSILIFFFFILILKIIIDILLYMWSKNLIKPFIGTEGRYFKIEINQLEESIIEIFNELNLKYKIEKRKSSMNQLHTLTIRFPKYKFEMKCSEQNSSINKSNILISNIETQDIEIINQLKSKLNTKVT
jgi:hypothetical protein